LIRNVPYVRIEESGNAITYSIDGGTVKLRLTVTVCTRPVTDNRTDG
ncbi:hypothetical protein AVEN_210415-1, partial [Araneus ventricosus]